MKSLLLIFILTVCNSILNARSWPIGTPDDLSSAFGPRNLGTENFDDPIPPDYDYDFHRGVDNQVLNRKVTLVK